MKLKLAVKWEVKIAGVQRSIQLFDATGNKLNGEESSWVGDFNCSNNKLATLAGAPSEVGGNFDCANNQLATLAGAPKEVGGDFYCSNNQLATLACAPSEVGGDFYCRNNQLATLAGAPKEVGGYFDCANNQLATLAGAPKEVGGDFYCANNQLATLAGAPKEVGGYFYCANNQLATLAGAPKENVSDLSVTLIASITIKIFNSKLKRNYVYADGIISKLVSRKKVGTLAIFRIRLIGKKKYSFLVKRGNIFSHGNTIKEAKDSLMYKNANRDTSEFKKWNLDTVVTVEKMIQAYRSITGACFKGTKDFCGNIKLPKKVAVKDAILLTAGKFGNVDFKNFFTPKNL